LRFYVRLLGFQERPESRNAAENRSVAPPCQAMEVKPW
jgi:hypothetical protein